MDHHHECEVSMAAQLEGNTTCRFLWGLGDRSSWTECHASDRFLSGLLLSVNPGISFRLWKLRDEASEERQHTRHCVDACAPMETKAFLPENDLATNLRLIRRPGVGREGRTSLKLQIDTPPTAGAVRCSAGRGETGRR